jgi:hypothetical protein
VFVVRCSLLVSMLLMVQVLVCEKTGSCPSKVVTGLQKSNWDGLPKKPSHAYRELSGKHLFSDTPKPLVA